MSMVEFSRPVEVARLGTAEARYDIAATAAERAALAKRFDLLSLDRLEARVTLRRVADDRVQLNAALSADLAQTDVVTLDPVPGHIEDDFTLLFAEEAGDAGALDPDAELVEPLIDGRIDIAEAVAQQLSLAIDPYPRLPAT
ncbi:MAG TPA: DUF177 domain-containing protein [Stellaceae bacterium]|jgi:uncharacterized metal-binding protein YceD (DUF177 family)|nr:DUF177 domain-containing protein [Stellaceae bacterium]